MDVKCTWLHGEPHHCRAMLCPTQREAPQPDWSHRLRIMRTRESATGHSTTRAVDKHPLFRHKGSVAGCGKSACSSIVVDRDRSNPCCGVVYGGRKYRIDQGRCGPP